MYVCSPIGIGLLVVEILHPKYPVPIFFKQSDKRYLKDIRQSLQTNSLVISPSIF
jgi:hypothetical protein